MKKKRERESGSTEICMEGESLGKGERKRDRRRGKRGLRRRWVQLMGSTREHKRQNKRWEDGKARKIGEGEGKR